MGNCISSPQNEAIKAAFRGLPVWPPSECFQLLDLVVLVNKRYQKLGGITLRNFLPSENFQDNEGNYLGLKVKSKDWKIDEYTATQGLNTGASVGISDTLKLLSFKISGSEQSEYSLQFAKLTECEFDTGYSNFVEIIAQNVNNLELDGKLYGAPKSVYVVTKTMNIGSVDMKAEKQSKTEVNVPVPAEGPANVSTSANSDANAEVIYKGEPKTIAFQAMKFKVRKGKLIKPELAMFRDRMSVEDMELEMFKDMIMEG